MNDEDIVIEAGRWLRLHADPGGIIAGTDMRTYDPGGIIAGADMRTYSLIGRLTTEIERLRAAYSSALENAARAFSERDEARARADELRAELVRLSTKTRLAYRVERDHPWEATDE